MKNYNILDAWRARKVNKYREDKAGSLSHDTTCCCYSLNTKCELSILYSCGHIFDKKCREEKRGQIERIYRKKKLVLNPMMKQGISNLFKKY